jgi:hypothetical protein
LPKNGSFTEIAFFSLKLPFLGKLEKCTLAYYRAR